MKFDTELRLVIDRKETAFERYIDSIIAGDIKKFKIKEEFIMFETLRQEYVAKLNALENADIEALVEEKVNEVRQQIREEVVAKHNEEVTIAKLQVKAIDELIANEEAKNISTESVENHEIIGG